MTYTLSLYEKAMPDNLPLFEKLRAARRLGYDGMELCVDLDPARQERLDWSSIERKEIAAFLIGEGLRIPTLSLSALRSCPLGDMRPGQNERAMTMLTKSMVLCCQLGIQVVLMNGYDVFDSPSTPETVDQFAENIEKAATLAASYGVTLGIENAERPFMDNMKKAAMWVRRIDNPYFRIYGDVGNAFNATAGDAGAALFDIAQGQGITAAMHLKDTHPGEYRYTRYGEGHVDFARAVALCLSMGVRLFTAELFLQPNLDWQAEAARVNQFLRQFFPNEAD